MTTRSKSNGTDPAQFVFLPLFGHSKPSVTPVEAAKVLGITDQQVRDLIEAGVFAAVPIGDDPNPRRKHFRILRCTVEAYWLERYLSERGEEFPWLNSQEVTAWRAKLRERGLRVTAFSPLNS